MNRLKALALGAFIVGTGGAVNAATYTFDFDTTNTGWVTNLPVASNEDAGVTLTAHGASQSDSHVLSDSGDQRVGTWTSAGLGVCSDYSSRYGCKDDDHRVDGNGGNDVAIFSLSEMLKLTSISFNYFEDKVIQAKYEWQKTTCARYRNGHCQDWNHAWVLVTPEQVFEDMFDLFADLGAGLTYQFTGGVEPVVPVADGYASLLFGIGASGKYDAFKVQSMTFESMPAAVPVPAAGLMLLAGLGGLASLRRGRKA